MDSAPATSRLMALHFTATESTFSCLEATRAYIERHAEHGALYSDKYSVFRKTGTNKGGKPAGARAADRDRMVTRQRIEGGEMLVLPTSATATSDQTDRSHVMKV
jgi:hypothetical protein